MANPRIFVSVAVLGLLLYAIPNEAFSYAYYSDDIGGTGQCAACHGAFNDNNINYVSNSEGVEWGTDLHSVHLDNTTITDNPNGSCGNCHFGAGTSGRQVDLNNSGNAKDGVNAIACMGCHGRLEDDTGDGQMGDGLRAHHMGSDNYLNWPGGIPGFLTCAQCHPGDTTPAPESTLPAWYASLTNNVVSLTMDPCNASDEENLAGLPQGLDNDGDQAYDAADWDCSLPGDSDRDGTSDILWRNSANGQNSLWLMAAGKRSGQQLVPTVTNTNWKMIGRGDHNGDGNTDILWRKSNPGQSDDGEMAIWLMQGGELLANLGLPSVPGTDWQVVGRGDYDGDGNADILWRNGDNGQNAMWRIVDGVLDANLAVSSVSNLDWTVVGDGDFDGDGNDDILWRNTATGGMALWRMDGASRLANEAVPSVTESGWVVMADGDYDGDGTADIFWRNTSTGLNAMWLMDGATRTANLPVLSFSSMDWQVAGADSDFDGDGMSDLYWRNTATGANSMWLMNSEQRVGHFSLPAVPPGEWEVAPIE